MAFDETVWIENEMIGVIFCVVGGFWLGRNIALTQRGDVRKYEIAGAVTLLFIGYALPF